MSLRDTYTLFAHERQLGALVKKMNAAAAALVRDIDIVNQRSATKGLKSLFSPIATGFLAGEWSRDTNTLSYTLVRDEVNLNRINYKSILASIRARNSDLLYVECKSATNDAIENRYLPNARLQIVDEMMTRHGNPLRNHEAYRALHAICADPAVDMRVELVVAATDSESLRDRFKDIQDYYVNFNGCVTATPRLKIRVYLDQPYRASTDAGIASSPATAPRVAAIRQG